MDRARFEKEIIELQLKRKIDNGFSIIKKCNWGYPQVIKSSLLKNNKPFPTVFWLTCPLLCKNVSRMEEKGMIKYFEEKLNRDGKMKKKFLEAHNSTQKLRNKSLPVDTPSWVKEDMSVKGIGGTKKLLTIKCLHLQLANYLGGIENPVGKLLWESIAIKNCPEDNIICEKLMRNDSKRNKRKN
ncbi:MAG: DUF501 domain-containing protein [Petrotogales bacterium]